MHTFFSIVAMSTYICHLSLLMFLSAAHCQDPTLPHISVQPSGGIFADGSPPIILECVAEDADSIQWAHNEGIITSDPSRTIGSDNALTIVSLNGDLAGNYTCLASNEVGTVTSAIAEIELAGEV